MGAGRLLFGCLVSLVVVGCASTRPQSAAPAPVTVEPAKPALQSYGPFAPLAPPSDTLAPEGRLAWQGFPGPKTAAAPLGQGLGWAVVPLGKDWTNVTVGLFDYVGPAGEDQVFKFGTRELAVPASFTAPASKETTLERGAPVLASVVVSAAYGRVVEAGRRVRVQVEFDGRLEEQDLEPAEILPLTGAIAFGAPVVVKNGDVEITATVANVAADRVWVVDRMGVPLEVPAKDVRPIDVKRVYAEGDKVLARRTTNLEPATVVSTQNGITYRVAFAAGGEAEVALDGVTAAPEPPADKAGPKPAKPTAAKR